MRRNVAAVGEPQAALDTQMAVATSAAAQGYSDRIVSPLSVIASTFPAGPGEGGCLYCPRCQYPFVDYSGCAALKCGGCGANFCALCLQLFDDGRVLHLHFVPPISAHAGVGRGYYVTTEEYFAFHRDKRAAGVRAAVAALTGESAEVRAGLLLTLLKGAGAPEPAAQPALAAPYEGNTIPVVAVVQHVAIPIVAIVSAAVNVNSAAAVVAEMGRRRGDLATAEWGCRTLSNISVGTGEYTDAQRQSIVDAGGVAAVVAALRAHPTRADIATKGCAALSDISAGTEAQRQAVVSADGAAAVMAALRAHASNTAVVARGCSALSNIAAGTDAQTQAVVAAGGAAALVAILRTHVTSAAIVTRCCAALSNIAAGTEMQKRAVVDADGTAAVVAALHVHSTSAAVTEHGCAALGIGSTDRSYVTATAQVPNRDTAL